MVNKYIAYFTSDNGLIESIRYIENMGIQIIEIVSDKYIKGLGCDEKKSKISLWGVAGALTGLFISTYFIYWLNSINYRIVLGDKPFFSLLNSIPVVFEVTILFSVIAIISAFLITSKLPNWYNSIDSKYILDKKKYGKYILIFPIDALEYSIDEIIKNLRNSGAVINKIEEETELSPQFVLTEKIRILKKSLKLVIFFIPIIILIFIISLKMNLLNYYPKSKNFELISDMDYQQKQMPQSLNSFFKDSSGTRLPPSNSVARDIPKYHFKSIDFEVAESYYSNPLIMNDTILKLAENRFRTHCVPCHDSTGKGKGSIITNVKLNPDEEGFPQPADLTSQTTKNKSDSQLFHILSAGQNLMFPVSHKLTETERWALVLYIRELQDKARR